MTINPHGGDAKATAVALGMDHAPEIRLDFSVNVNPLGPPSCVSAILSNGIHSITQYPQITAREAVTALANAHHVSESSIIAGNGSTEIFSWLVHALSPKRPAWVSPSYRGYKEVCSAADLSGFTISATSPLDNFAVSIEKVKETDSDMIFLASPNNPTGTTIDPACVLDLALCRTSRWIVLDESFIDFLPEPDQHTLIRNALPQNLIVVKSLTKFFAIPGLRLGMACAHPDTMKRIKTVRLPWSVNALAQQAAQVLYQDREYIEKSRKTVSILRHEFSSKLSELPGFTVYRSETNFLLVKLPQEWPASRLQGELLKHGILIRSCANFAGLGEQYCRFAVRPRKEINELIEVLTSII